jgi:endonuclease/exonuclease/phosphatase family metal-dependent hydrolase
VRIASFNVENLFDRAKALNLPTWAEGRVVLERYARINKLLQKPVYTAADKRTIAEVLAGLGLARSDDGGEFARLRQNRGRLVRRPATGGIEVVAERREDWIGWVELKSEPVNELAMEHTAMVIRDVDADVLAVIEADNRVALKKFSSLLLERVGALPYAHVMVIDGNDDRGIDVGLMTKRGHDIVGMVSHVDDRDAKGEIFSRDCPEYAVTTPSGARLVLLVNHLKSKGFGSFAASSEKRERQARRVAAIYRRLVSEGERNVAVLGDFNDTPDSRPLRPLLAETDLRDISMHPSFADDGRPGTFGNGTKSGKFDYVLLSPALFASVTGGGVWRKGVWGGTHGNLWPIYETMTRPIHAASDHAAVFADVAV